MKWTRTSGLSIQQVSLTHLERKVAAARISALFSLTSICGREVVIDNLLVRNHLVALLYRGYRHVQSRFLQERESFINNLLVRIHFIIVMLRWTGLTQWECVFPFSGSLTYTFLYLREFIVYKASMIERVY